MPGPTLFLVALALHLGWLAAAVAAAPPVPLAPRDPTLHKRELLQSAKIGLSVGLSAGLIIAAGGVLWLWLASKRASRQGRRIGERAPKHGEPVELAKQPESNTTRTTA